MSAFNRLTCSRCGARIELAESHVRVPQPGRVPGTIGRDRSEYRCKQCDQHHVVRPTRLAIVVLPILILLALSLAYFDVGRGIVIGVFAVGAAAVYPFSARLEPV